MLYTTVLLALLGMPSAVHSVTEPKQKTSELLRDLLNENNGQLPRLEEHQRE